MTATTTSRSTTTYTGNDPAVLATEASNQAEQMSSLQETAVDSLVLAASRVNLSQVEVVDGVAVIQEEELENAQGMTLLTKAIVVLDASKGLRTSVGRTSSSVSVPAETLQQLQSEDMTPLAVSFGVFPESTDQYQAFKAGSAEELVASEVISILITGPDGKIFRGPLPEPIEIQLSTKAVHRRNACVFWDEELSAWSTEGVTMVGVTNGTTTCLTTHLSVFTLILAVLTCSQAAFIFSQDALIGLVSTPWAWQSPALVNWGLILVAGCLLRLAHRADRQHQSQMRRLNTWARECHASKDVSADVLAVLQVVRQCRRICHSGAQSARTFIYSTVLRNRLGVDRRYLEGLLHGVGKTEVHRKAEAELEDFRHSPWYRQFRILWSSFCKWTNVMAPSWKLASVDRCLLMFAKLYSTWALSAIFFGGTSVGRGQDPDCEKPAEFWAQMVQCAAVAWISGTFSALPVLCLVLVQNACGARVEAARTTFRSFVLAYSVFCLLTVCLFLAARRECPHKKCFHDSES